jgi:hypothetical protein
VSDSLKTTEPVSCRWIEIQRCKGVVYLGLRQELTGEGRGYGSTVKLDAGEEDLDGGDADRRRRLDSTTVHQQQLRQRSRTPGTRRLGLAAPRMFPRERGRKKSGDR